MSSRAGWLLLAVLVLAGCSTHEGAADSPGMRTITDMEGRSVRVPAPDRIRRAAILTSPAVQIAYILGCQDRLCAVTQAVKRWPLLSQLDPRIEQVPACRASAGQVNLEALLATNPDVCIGSVLDLHTIETQTSIPALHVAAGGSRDFTRQIEEEVAFLGRVFGREERARRSLKWLSDSRQRLRGSVSDVEAARRPKVFMGFGSDHLTTFGTSTFMHEWIEAALCRNAAESVSTAGGKEGGLAQVSMEQVLQWAPDVVVLDEGDPGHLREDPQWTAVPAVRAGRVFRLPTGIFIWNRASFESAVLLPLWLTVNAYPERFRDTSLDEDIRRFYREVFSFEPTDAQLRAVLHPEAP
jgi:iron complex transport system substrate-binding protein